HYITCYQNRRHTPLTAPDCRPGTRQQLVDLERLDEIVVSPSVEPSDSFAPAVPRRHDNHRCRIVSTAQLRQDAHAGAPWQAQAQQYQLVVMVDQGGQRRTRVAGNIDTRPLTA